MQRNPRTALIAISAVLVLTATATGQEPTCDLRLAGDGYTVCYESGYAADAELAREILDLAVQRLGMKYGRAEPFDLEVKLYAEPTAAVHAGRTYFDGGAIHYLTPSAPERHGRTSSLGLPLDGIAFHYKTLTHEFFHAFHRARNRNSFDWSGWFREGLAEYEGIFNTAPYNGDDTHDRLIREVHDEQRHRVFCCRTLEPGIETITTTDIYNAGATILWFLEDRFGPGVHVRLLTSRLSTFEEGLTDALSSHATTVAEAFEQLREWLAERYATRDGPGRAPEYKPNMTCTGRYWTRRTGRLSFEVRIVNNDQRPADHVVFQHQYRTGASIPWVTSPELSSVRLDATSYGNAVPLFTSVSSPPFRWRARSCPVAAQTDDVCSDWSNVIEWTAASCAAREIR